MTGATRGAGRPFGALLGRAALAVATLAVGFVVGRGLAARGGLPGAPTGAPAATLPVTFHPAAGVDGPPFDEADLPPAAGMLERGPVALGQPAPDFELAALAADAPVRLSDHRGGPVLINFWATWCAPCRAEMPLLQAMADELAGRGLVVLAVDVDEPPRMAVSFTRSMGLTLPLLFDVTSEVANHYRVTSFPTTYVVDPAGRLASVMRGAYTSEDQLRDAVTRHLAEAPNG